MAEPSSALTMRDLVLEVAEKLRVCEYNSSGVRHVPTDLFNLDLCKRYVNNGIRMFMSDRPKNGWRWMRRICSVTTAPTYMGTATAGTTTTLTDSGIADTYADDYFNGYTLYLTAGTGIGTSLTVTDYDGSDGKFTFAATTAPDTTTTYRICTSANAILGDGARYMLPANFGGMYDGPIKYAEDSNHATDIQWCDESAIRARRSITVNTGYPVLAAIRPYQPTSEALSTTRRWELIVDPRPSAAEILEFPYTLYFDNMTIFSGTATGGAADSLTDTTRTEPNDYFNGMVIKVVAGTGLNSYATITDYVKSTGVISVTKWLDIDGASTGTSPAASSIYTIETTTNLHPAGFQFDDAVMAAVLARTEMESQDQHGDSFWSEYYLKKSLPSARDIDARSGPRKLGNMDGRTGPVRERTWTDVTTSHDV